MATTANIKGRVLEVIKRHGPISVSGIQRHVAADDKAIRNAIDALRKESEPIWHAKQGFWWRNDVAPSTRPGDGRWKRDFTSI